MIKIWAEDNELRESIWGKKKKKDTDDDFGSIISNFASFY
jgi:hypothetical protein